MTTDNPPQKPRKRRKQADRRAARDSNLKDKYGISAEHYDAMFRAQGGVCAICESPPGARALAVDHCHTHGKVRGLLCVSCNIGIGCFKESINLFARAAGYVTKPPFCGGGK